MRCVFETFYREEQLVVRVRVVRLIWRIFVCSLLDSIDVEHHVRTADGVGGGMRLDAECIKCCTYVEAVSIEDQDDETSDQPVNSKVALRGMLRPA